MASFGPGDIEDMLRAMALNNFEPHSPEQLPPARAHIVYDSTALISKLEAYIGGLSVRKDFKHYLKLLTALLHTNPQLFTANREALESRIIEKRSALLAKQGLVSDVVRKGCISGFWSDNFKV